MRLIRLLLVFMGVVVSNPTAHASGFIRDAEIENLLADYSRPLFLAAGLSPNTVGIALINNKSLNAFVANGQNIYFHTGLILESEDPNMVIGVIAHEVGHITSGHIVRRIDAMQNARIQAMIATILGIGVGVGAGNAGAGIGAKSIGDRIAERKLLKFTRSQEASADQAALQFMNRANIDPSAMLHVLQRLQREQAIFIGQVDPYALTHPLSSQRIALLERGVKASPALGNKVGRDLAYWHGRMRAKLAGFLAPPEQIGGQRFSDPELELYRQTIALHRLPAPDRAIASADKLIDLRPNDPYYLELKGQILAESGRAALAVAPYEKALRLEPDSALIAGGLAEALLAVGSAKSLRRALGVLKKAAVDDAYAPRIKRALAIAYARNGDPGMATVITSERLALIGRLAEAKSQARRAQALLPSGSPGWIRADDVLSLPGG